MSTWIGPPKAIHGYVKSGTIRSICKGVVEGLPVNGWRSDSVFTPWHTSVRRWALKSLSSLWRIVEKPPHGQERSCWTMKLEPQTHWVGVEGGCQPYCKEMASTKALLWRQKPNWHIGGEVSQVDAHCSLAKSIAFLDDSGNLVNLVLRSLATCFTFCSHCSFVFCLAWSWAGKHPKEYLLLFFFVKMSFFSGSVTIEDWNSLSADSAVFLRPRPPNIAGRAKRISSLSPGGSLPANLGTFVFARETVSAGSFGSPARAIPAETTAVAATVLHHFLALSEHSKSLLHGCLPYWSLYPSENTKAALSQSLVIRSLCFLFEETARSSA